MSKREYFPGKLRVYYKDLLAAGIVSNRTDLHFKIGTGRLRPPYKEGNKAQSRAFWLPDEIARDVERDVERLRKQAAE